MKPVLQTKGPVDEVPNDGDAGLLLLNDLYAQYKESGVFDRLSEDYKEPDRFPVIKWSEGGEAMVTAAIAFLRIMPIVALGHLQAARTYDPYLEDVIAPALFTSGLDLHELDCLITFFNITTTLITKHFGNVQAENYMRYSPSEAKQPHLSDQALQAIVSAEGIGVGRGVSVEGETIKVSTQASGDGGLQR